MAAHRMLQRMFSRTARRMMIAAVLAAVLTISLDELPKIDLLKAGINDDNFADLVLQTRGELPIDTNIRILTYDATMLDTFDMVDRAQLAMQLASLFELKPRIVAVDFLVETARQEAPEGDAMLSALVADHPNLLLGIFFEDSLNRFRIPPRSLNIPAAQLGCINIVTDADNTIRRYRPLWGADGGPTFESYDVKVAHAVDSSATAYLRSFGNEEFIIDYAAGIGETQRNGAAGDQIFPVMPLAEVFRVVSSGDSAATAALREQFAGKAVLVGYGDLRGGQVTSVVDRFYTPFKPEKNTLPDMHGVAIHANIVNTILQRRVLEQIPTWANVIWAAAVVCLVLAGRERLKRLKSPTLRTVYTYAGFISMMVVAALIPVLTFRYTPYKLSIFMPIGAMLLAVPTLEGLNKAIDMIMDLRRRARLRRPLPPSIQAGMQAILRAWGIDERMELAIHFLQTQFHLVTAVLFAEAATGRCPRFQPAHLNAPTITNMGADAELLLAAPDAISTTARTAARAVALMANDPLLARTLRLSRSMYIALNEIRRQSSEEPADERHLTRNADDAAQSTTSYADLALKTLAAGGGDDGERFDALYAALERYAAAMAGLLRRPDGSVADLLAPGQDLAPFAFTCRCAQHGTNEHFVYVCVQEDANSTDDFFDLVFAGQTIRCQPVEHPGLSLFREQAASSILPAAADPATDN